MKLISLNIEGHRHYDRIIPFLRESAADVIALQEAPESFQHELQVMGYKTDFLPMLLRQNGAELSPEGVVLAARHRVSFTQQYYFKGRPEIVEQDPNDKHSTTSYGYILAEVEMHNQTHRIATTHFPWAPDGDRATPEQEADMATLIAMLQDEAAHILCGDFNIPRGYNRLYDTLVQNYTDHIPPSYTYSLDPELHRLRDNEEKRFLLTRYMVDYLFTSPDFPYTVSDVQLQFGLSDHAAIVATIN